VTEWLAQLWAGVRRATGDDAYDVYLAHWHEHHARDPARDPAAQPLDRAAFFREEQKRKWEGIRRCC
jgi:uncharacterized short protein YbdD (DUF466 family)